MLEVQKNTFKIAKCYCLHKFFSDDLNPKLKLHNTLLLNRL